MHLGMAEYCLPFSGHCDLDLALIDFCLARRPSDSRNSSVFFLILLFQAVYTIRVQINLNKI